MLVQEALKLVQEGLTPQEAAEKLRGAISWRTIYRAMKAAGIEGPKGGAGKGARADAAVVAERKAPVVTLPSPDEPGLAPPLAEPTLQRARPVAMPASPEPPPVPEGLTGAKRDLWILDWEIQQTRLTLGRMRAEGDQRTASLQGQLLKLMQERREIEPPPPPDEDEGRRWRAAADRVLTKIRAGVASS